MTTNLELVTSYMKAVDAHDLDTVRNGYADDIEIRAPHGVLTGPDAAVAWIEEALRAFPDGRHEILSSVEAGDTIAVEGRFSGTHTGLITSAAGDVPPTGNSVQIALAAVFRFTDGRMRSEHVYTDQLSLFKQLGLLPD